MKQLKLSWFLAMLCSMMSMDVMAHDAYVDGIYYNLNTSANTATVTYYGDSPVLYQYSGSITIPSSITYKNKTYKVVSIGYRAFYQCNKLTSVTLPEGLNSIAQEAFYDCKQISSITIPSSVTNIVNNAFTDCNALTTVTINSETVLNKGQSVNNMFGSQVKTYNVGSNVTSLGAYAFSSCSSMTSVYIPNNVTKIDVGTFKNCSSLSSITIPANVSSIGASAFEGCTNLKSINIPNKVEIISASLFSGCNNLTQITFPNNLKSIGNYAFNGCSKLIQITIPSSVDNISERAFIDCKELSIIKVEDGNTVYDSRNNCNAIIVTSNDSLIIGCKQTIIPNDVKIIGDYAFKGSGLTSITIPEGVKKIGYYSFYETGLTSVFIPNNVLEIGTCAFWTSTLISATIDSDSIMSKDGKWNSSTKKFDNVIEFFKTQEIIIGQHVTRIGDYKFFMSDITSITLSSSVTSIGSWAFEQCTKLTSIDIPESVTSIGVSAFNGSGISNFDLHDNIICSDAFNKGNYIWVNKGSKTLLSLWDGYTYPNFVFQKGTEEKILKPSLSFVSATQTSITLKLENQDEGYLYKYKSSLADNEFDMDLNSDNIFTMGCGYPETKYTIPIQISKGDYSILIYSDYVTTKPITPICHFDVTASSIKVTGSYSVGDAHVSAEYMYMTNPNTRVEDNTMTVYGLNPGTSYQVEYRIVVSYTKDNVDHSNYYSVKQSVTTSPLTLTTSQPKVVSEGNVIVAAQSNLDDAEENVGFEWRRTDWSDDFASNTGIAYLYEGEMEGYIRNLNTNYLWKFRPFYLSDSGTYYYGDWIGLDPTNTSYFEPSVHTYADIDVTGNTALVKGYALAGTDDITVQGFKYWKEVSGGQANGTLHAPSIPGNAMTVEAEGRVMEVMLSGLDYESDYKYVAFVKTSEGDTFYGDVRSFTTEVNTSGIEQINIDGSNTGDIYEVARYNLRGQKIDTPERGINIIRLSDGTTRKVMVK